MEQNLSEVWLKQKEYAFKKCYFFLFYVECKPIKTDDKSFKGLRIVNNLNHKIPLAPDHKIDVFLQKFPDVISIQINNPLKPMEEGCFPGERGVQVAI